MDKITSLTNINAHVEQMKKYAREFDCVVSLDVAMSDGSVVTIQVRDKKKRS